MYDLQTAKTLLINDPAFNATSVTAYVGANGDVEKVERDDLPSDFGMAYGRMVKEVETKSTLQQISDAFKYAWTQTKLGFRKFGILLGIIPKVSQKTHPNVFHPEKEQRDVHNPMLKELKSNPPKLNSVKGFSFQDIENRREAEFNKRMSEALKDRELRPLLTSVKQVAKQTAAKERRNAIADEKKETVANDNAKRHARFAENKASIQQEAKEKHEAHELKLKKAEKNREDILAAKKKKAMAANKHREEVRAKATEQTGAALEVKMLFDQLKRQREEIELLKERVRAAEKLFTTQSHTVTTV